MKKIFKLMALALFLVTATVSSTNAAFPKEKQTTETTVASPTTTTVADAPVTKSVVKSELKKATKNAGSKSKIIAALLAFFLGAFGVHSFYMGNKKKGLIQLGLGLGGLILIIVGVASAVTSLTTGTISVPVLAIIGYIMLLGVSIWALVDLIRILTGGLAPEEGFND